MTEQVCKNCRFFRRTEPLGGGLKWKYDGECCRYAPKPISKPEVIDSGFYGGITAPIAAWPLVNFGWWCGEFQERKDENP